MHRVFTLCLLLLIFSSSAQDNFDILRNSGEDFARVVRGKALNFPADHAPHPDYRIEWWYITANLQDTAGRQWGLQWTLFRHAMSTRQQEQGWSSNQLWMAHAAISGPTGHHHEERYARGGIGQAGVALDGKFEAWIDDWIWQASGRSPFPSRLSFQVADKKVEMQLQSDAGWVLHGDKGYSQKSQRGQASYYYSQPRIKIQGRIGDESVSGQAWLDREWSSQPLAPDQQGWDWFSLHLDDGNKLMVYRLRHDSGDHWLSGSWIDSDGKKIHLDQQDIVLIEQEIRQIDAKDKGKIRLPLDWSIGLPGRNLELMVTPLYDQQWMGTSFSYWEGVVLVEDGQGERVGRGYMELTGYR